MYSPQISGADLEYASYEKDRHESYQIRRRMHMLLMLDMGYPHKEIATVLGVTSKTVTEWIKMYQNRGLEALTTLHYKGQPSALLAHTSKLRTEIDKHSPGTLWEVADLIDKETGIRRSLTQVRYYIRTHLGIKRRKILPFPGGKMSPEELARKQHDFLHAVLEPLLNKAISGQIQLFFCDATHPVMGFHGGYVYGSEPRCLRTAHGRHRMNLYSALNAVSHTLHTIYGAQYVSAETAEQLIEQLRACYPGKQIYLILDNARYQRCKYVEKAARRKRVHLVFLPPYSPNLNLIERLWKYFKKQVLTGKYFPDKKSFENAILGFLEELENGLHEEELNSLLTFKFQDLEKDIQKLTNLAA